MKITTHLLQEWGACDEGLWMFEDEFPEGADIFEVFKACYENGRDDYLHWIREMFYCHGLVDREYIELSGRALIALFNGTMQKHTVIGDFSDHATTGAEGLSAAFGYESHSATTGDSAHSVASGIKSNSITAGYGADSVTCANKSNSVTAGNESCSTTIGLNSHSVTAGNRSRSSTTGCFSNSATTGDSAASATMGDKSCSLAAGALSSSVTTGKCAHSATTGNFSESTTIGDEAHSISAGNHVNVSAIGENSVVMSAGLANRIKMGEGGCAAVAYYDENGKRRIAVAYVGEDGIEANVAYRVNTDGKFIKIDIVLENEKEINKEKIQ